jgi:mRNA-degrading endonuclease toxin of MazEF toxin-antitoxin module
MLEFQRGDVFRCHFPDRVLNSLYTPPPDYARIEGQSALAVCLTDSNDRRIPNGQALVVPIVDQAVKLNNQTSLKPVVVPLEKENLSFLPFDAYALTHQPIACNRHWIGPEKVGHIPFSSAEMQRIDLGLLLSTGTYEMMREEIYKEVTNALIEKAGQVSGEKQVAAADLFSNMTVVNQPTHAHNFRRGDVFWCNFPPHDLSSGVPLPDYSIRGKHMGICLTDAKDPRLPQEQVLVVPISTAQSAAEKGILKPTHIPLEKSQNPFLDHDSYALTFQTVPYNRHWLTQSVGRLSPQSMDKVTLGLLLSTGTYERVVETIRSAVHEALLQRTMNTPTLQRMNDFELGR